MPATPENSFSAIRILWKNPRLSFPANAKKIFDELRNWKNIKVYDSDSNFILVRLLTDKITAAEIFEYMVRKKMVIRDAASFTFLDESYLRFCILTPEENERLLRELKSIVEQ